MSNRNEIAIVALTKGGLNTAQILSKRLKQPSKLYTIKRFSNENVQVLEGNVLESISQLFTKVDVLICIMATGIVVRAIANVINDKAKDPAVIVLDEKAQNVISLLSGHLGGANTLTKEIARLMQANPVITTATDINEVTSLDLIAKSVNGWRENLRPLVIQFNSYLANNETVYFFQEKHWVHDLRGLTLINLTELDVYLNSTKPLILLQTTPVKQVRDNLAVIYPKPYVLGIGTRKNIKFEILYEGFKNFCKKEKIEPGEISKIVSIDQKKHECSIIELSILLGCPFETYSKEVLELVSQKYPQSEFVKMTVGVGSVAMASVDIATGGNVKSERFTFNGCTYALGKINL